MDFKYKKKYVGEPGADGSKKRQAGKNGEDLVLKSSARNNNKKTKLLI